MINLKFVGILAVFGFLLSFVLGLLGDVTFGFVVLRAVISALVSGGTAALVSFVFRKFLSENAAETTTARPSSSTGNIIDIRVEEEPLPDSDNSPDFYVSQAYSSASNAFPYSQQAKQPASSAEPVKPAPAADFKAVPLGNIASSSGKDSVVEKNQEPKVAPFVPKPLAQKETPVVSNAGSAVTRTATSEKHSVSEELDSLEELPDIESMVSDSLESETSVIEDSAFATEGSNSGVAIPDISSGGDTTVIADAIRTLLKREG